MLGANPLDQLNPGLAVLLRRFVAVPGDLSWVFFSYKGYMNEYVGCVMVIEQAFNTWDAVWGISLVGFFMGVWSSSHNKYSLYS